MFDLLPIVTLGFLGSFGHCAGMCGPLTVAFSLSQQRQETPSWYRSPIFHLLLNLGRIVSYAIVGMALGQVGSVLIASGQFAGVGSSFRQGMAIFTGLMLIGFGLSQVKPDFLPRLPILHPLQGKFHEDFFRMMTRISLQTQWWIPAILGSLWGLIPCGFLYAAQLKAAETGSPIWGAATMLAFGLGTMPTMLGVGVSTAKLSASRRSQLFRLGGWVTLAIGILTLLRSDAMVDLTGHASLLLLMLALVARPISRVWKAPLGYRRAIGVGAFVLAVAHTAHMMEHTLNWQLGAIAFMVPVHRWGLWLGTTALVLMIPAALTSFDYWQQVLGKRWRQIHLLTVPAMILAAIHAMLIGSSYLGGLVLSWDRQIGSIVLGIAVLAVFWVRSRWVWVLFSREEFYTRSVNHDR
ncbi:MAG: sulfite exporter TauE/SafE family protein [Geitlerinemataceae cyanobacterium]